MKFYINSIKIHTYKLEGDLFLQRIRKVFSFLSLMK